MAEPETPKDTAEQTPPPTGPDFYINGVSFAASVYEFVLNFTFRRGGNTVPEHVVSIRMSPQHAKVMSRMFARQVKSYEQEIGPIYLPAKLIADLKLEDIDKS
jgi:hypothetical protein